MSGIFWRRLAAAKPIAVGASTGAGAGAVAAGANILYSERSGSEQQQPGRVQVYAESITLSGAKYNARPETNSTSRDQGCAEGDFDDEMSASLPVIPRVTVSAVQFDAAVRAYAEHPDILLGQLGDGFLSGRGMIERLLHDKEVLASMRQKVEEHNINVKVKNSVECPSSGEVVKRWEELCAKHGCSICLDVRAAPVVLACTHSFCYACVRDLKERATVEEDEDLIVPSARSTAVVHKCPDCRKALEGSENFSRDYDNIIYADVQSVPDCEQKTAYLERRNVYFEQERAEMERRREKLRAVEEARAGITSSSEGTSSAWSVFASLALGDAELASEQQEWYDLFKYYAVPYLVGAVITLVAVTFYHSKADRR